ncbi:hypothetical protein CEXT_591091 [Caerostris extrusa]|uniref:Uncharacterized protein n=1 Tax=Caerostris extrusa TaxID=172846 RepID=A0AAV4VVY2_CAEEX|nr:hypothetical protein CEXT_591091 [Caerostris extrusa]
MDGSSDKNGTNDKNGINDSHYPIITPSHLIRIGTHYLPIEPPSLMGILTEDCILRQSQIQVRQSFCSFVYAPFFSGQLNQHTVDRFDKFSYLYFNSVLAADCRSRHPAS